MNSSTIASLLPFVLIAGAFWLLIIRPARARQRNQQATVSQVAVGSRVMTTSGMFGTVTAVRDDEIDLEIAPGVAVRYMKAAIARVEPNPGTTAVLGSSSVGDTPTDPPDSDSADAS